MLIALMGWNIMLHYSDDFLAVLHPDQDPLKFSQQFDSIAISVGLRVNTRKDLTGTTAEFLGIEIDTIAMEARLPEEKLAKIKQAVRQVMRDPFTTHKDLDSLVGLLSFASKVFIPGTSFLRRFYDALSKGTPFIHLTISMKQDLQWWYAYLDHWNGIHILRSAASRKTFHAYTDASGSYGMGGYILNGSESINDVRHAFALRFHSAERGHDIQYKDESHPNLR